MIDEELLERLFTKTNVLGDDEIYVRDDIHMFKAFGQRDLWYISLNGGYYNTAEGVNGLLHFIDML